MVLEIEKSKVKFHKHINVSNVDMVQFNPLMKGIQMFIHNECESKQFYFEGSCQISGDSVHMQNVTEVTDDNEEEVFGYKTPDECIAVDTKEEEPF